MTTSRHVSADEQLPAGTYDWRIQLMWPARPGDVAGWPSDRLVGEPFFATWNGTVTLETPTTHAEVCDYLRRQLEAGCSVPPSAEVTRFTRTPAGGAQ